MPRQPTSPHARGVSEVWTRPTLKRAIESTRRRLGKRLRAIREERGLTQEQAAELAGLHAKYLSRVELGLPNASIAALVALAYAYRLPVAAFFEGLPVPR